MFKLIIFKIPFPFLQLEKYTEKLAMQPKSSAKSEIFPMASFQVRLGII